MSGLREELLPVRGGGNGTDPGGTKPPAWQHNGAVVQEANAPDVFILFAVDVPNYTSATFTVRLG
jgi:hypothetical protein